MAWPNHKTIEWLSTNKDIQISLVAGQSSWYWCIYFAKSFFKKLVNLYHEKWALCSSLFLLFGISHVMSKSQPYWVTIRRKNIFTSFKVIQNPYIQIDYKISATVLFHIASLILLLSKNIVKDLWHLIIRVMKSYSK